MTFRLTVRFAEFESYDDAKDFADKLQKLKTTKDKFENSGITNVTGTFVPPTPKDVPQFTRAPLASDEQLAELRTKLNQGGKAGSGS